MNFVEIQVEETTFRALVEALASLGPANPIPVFPFLPAGQLIRSLKITGSSYLPPGVPGTLSISISATVNHISIDQLQTNPNAAGTNLAVKLQTVALFQQNQRITLFVTGVEAGGVNHPFTIPALLGSPSPPLSPSFNPSTPVSVKRAGLFHDAAAKMVTARFALSDDSAPLLFDIPIFDRRAGNVWAIFIDKDVMTSTTKLSIDDNLAQNLPSDVQIENPTEVTWTEVEGAWGIDITVGLLAVDACPSYFFDDADISVELDGRIEIETNLVDQNITMTLHVWHDVSLWDENRCGLQNALSGIALVAVPVYGAISVALGSLEMIAPFILPALIESKVSDVIGGQSVTGFTKLKTQQGDDATYGMSINMPILPLPATKATDAVVDYDGITVRGDQPIVVPGVHTITVSPTSVAGSWYGYFTCDTQTWTSGYQCQPVVVNDNVKLGSQTIAIPVRIFPATAVRPPAQWSFVYQNGIAATIQVNPMGVPVAGEGGTLYVHSTAGLAQIPINKVPAPPPGPTALQLMEMKLNCVQAGNRWNGPRDFDLHWLVDPPPYDSIVEVLRQWQIQIDNLPTGSTIDFEAVGPGVGQRARVIGSGTRQLIGMITGSRQVLHVTLGASQVKAAVAQRLLLANEIVDLGASIAELARTGGDAIAALTPNHITILGPHGAIVSRHANQGAIGLVRDVGGLIAWGPTGAFLIVGDAAGMLTDEGINAVTRARDGSVVLHGVNGQMTVKGTRVERIGSARNVASANGRVQTVTLARGRVVVANGTRVLFTFPWGERRNVIL